MMRAPSAGCVCISVRSSGVSLPGFKRISNGTRTFPRSCSRPATPNARTSPPLIPRYSASAIVRTATFMECVVVY